MQKIKVDRTFPMYLSNFSTTFMTKPHDYTNVSRNKVVSVVTRKRPKLRMLYILVPVCCVRLCEFYELSTKPSAVMFDSSTDVILQFLETFLQSRLIASDSKPTGIKFLRLSSVFEPSSLVKNFSAFIPEEDRLDVVLYLSFIFFFEWGNDG